jgi:hypothetical protein
MTNRFRALVLVVASISPTISEADSRDIEYIVQQTVTRELFEGALQAQRALIIGAMENDFRAKGIEVSDLDGFFDIFFETWIDEFTIQMQLETGAIYNRLFSETELAAIAEFYKSAPGQALIEKTPELMQAAALLGAQVGTRAAQTTNSRLAARLENEGITFGSPSLMRKLVEALK